MKRRWYVVVFTALILGILLVTTGCQGVSGPGGASASKGTLTVTVTDAPPGVDVTSIMVTVSKIEVHKAEGDLTQAQAEGQAGNSDGEWLAVDIPAATRTFDLLKIKGVEQLLASTLLDAGKYTQIRLTVDKTEVTLKGEASKSATVPSDALKLVHPFDIVAGETTTLTLDFDAEKSVKVTGQGAVHIKPVIKLVVKPPKSEQPAQITKESSQKLALDFIKNSPTFLSDGIISTLVLKDSSASGVASTWQFTCEFDCQHAGYGDRIGQVLAQVIAHHRVVITVENGTVTAAVLDGKWNEITQEEIAVN